MKEENQKNQDQHPSEPITCKYCDQDIRPKASKCHECGSYQKAWKNWLAHVPLIVSIVMVILAIVQLSLAWQKQIVASEALEKAIEVERVADDAMGKIEDLYQQAKESVDEIENTKTKIFGVESDLARIQKSLVAIEYYRVKGRTQIPNPYDKKILEIVDEILIIVEPNPEKRAKFIKELESYKLK